MTTIPVERELLEQVTIELEHDTDRYILGRELRKLLSEQPQADHSAQDLNMVEHPQAGAGQGHAKAALSAENQRIVPVEPLLAKPHPLAARHDKGDEVRRLREALKQAEKNERHGNNAETRYWCDQYKQLAKAALTHSPKGAEE